MGFLVIEALVAPAGPGAGGTALGRVPCDGDGEPGWRASTGFNASAGDRRTVTVCDSPLREGLPSATQSVGKHHLPGSSTKNPDQIGACHDDRHGFCTRCGDV
jgi:hypothetical protein